MRMEATATRYGGAVNPCASSGENPMAARIVGRNIGTLLNETFTAKKREARMYAFGSLRGARAAFHSKPFLWRRGRGGSRSFAI